MAQVLETAGFDAPRVVAQQEQPDPDFPTVAFPNPEEPGAMDLAMALAEEHGADLVVANDPDADRCAAAVPGPHGWRMLRGDEVGALLGHHLLRRGRAGTYATTIVSSTLLGAMARAAGQPYVETLTGFKWIGRVDGLAFGYEEALGYCVDPDHVQDKDGVSALLLLCELAAQTKADGPHPGRRPRRPGHRPRAARHRPAVGAGRRPEPDHRRRWRGCVARRPPTLGGFAVVGVDDLALGSLETTGLPPTEGLRFRLAEDARVVVRPSGTEPKLKCYLEVVVPVDVEAGVDASRIAAAAPPGRAQARHRRGARDLRPDDQQRRSSSTSGHARSTRAARRSPATPAGAVPAPPAPAPRRSSAVDAVPRRGPASIRSRSRPSTWSA